MTDFRAAIPSGLLVADSLTLQTKLREFSRVGASGIHLVFDFDRTLTVKKPGSDDEVTTWHILREHLPEEGQAEYGRLFETYRAKELVGGLTEKEAVDWWSASLKLFVKHKVDLKQVELDFLERASIRPGVSELFELCKGHSIPTVVLSAGISDVIEIWCRHFNIEPTLILSTRLILNKNHTVIGWQENTLVHALNKSEATHAELARIRSAYPKAFVIGDSLDDASMAAGERDVIRVRILDPRADERTNEQEIRKTLKEFDLLIQSGALHPLSKVIKTVI